jgi:hypothetical protein
MVSTIVPFLAFVIAAAANPPEPPPAPGTPPVGYRTVEGYWQPGGYEGRIGSPYFYSVPVAGYGSPGQGQFGRCGVDGRNIVGYGYGYQSAYYGGSGWMGYDPYTYHFGPGYYRYAEHGHFRFPYYSYRRPWYHPGPAVFNRDTNFAW